MTDPTGEADFGAVLEDLPAVAGSVEGGHQVPGVGVVLAEQAVKLPVPHQLHPVVTHTHTETHVISPWRHTQPQPSLVYQVTHANTHAIRP